MTGSKGGGRLSKMLVWLHWGEDIALSLLLVLTLGLAIGQIILRNLLATSFVWADTLVRILILWIGMLGAIIATREQKHISIDLISRYLAPSHRLIVKAVVSLFAGCVCALAGYFSLLFVITEYHAGEIAFASVPAWLCEAILPVAFVMMAMRFVIQSGISLSQLRKAGSS